MPYTQINNSVRGLDKIAKTIAVPREHKAERIPTFPALERTGVLSFTDTTTVTVPYLSSLEAMVCRDPAFPVWVKQIPSPNPFSYYVMLSGNGDLVELNVEYGPIPVGDMSNFYTNSSSFLNTPDFAAPVIRYGGKLFFYNMTDMVGIAIRTDRDPGVVDSIMTLEIIDNNTNVLTTVIPSFLNVVGTTTGISIPLPANTIAFRLVSLEVRGTIQAIVTSAAFGVTTTILSTIATALISPVDVCRSVLYPVSKPVEASATTVPWKSVRSTAVGALFSNVTAVLNKEGTIKAARVSSETTCVLASSAYNTAIDKVYPKDRYFGPMENGLYTFTLPDSGSEIYRDTLQNSVSQILPVWVAVNRPPAVFDLDKLSYANLIVFTDIGDNDTTLAITIDRHIEFRSSSVLFPLGFSTCQLETYHAAQMALVQLGVFFENPLHLGLIGTAVASAVRAVAPYVYPAVKQVGKAALMAAGDKLLSMANSKLGQMSQQAKMVKQSQPKRQVVVTKKAKVKPKRK